MKLDIAGAAKMLGVDEATIYRWIREERIPVHRVNDRPHFHSAELLEWATARGIRVSSEAFRDDRATDAPSVGLAGALAEGGIHRGLKGSTREQIVRAVVDLMPVEDEERELLYDFLLAREALGSTGVGDGIAIPHVRNPIVLQVPKPTITLCFLEEPVDFKAIDGKPVHTIFTLVTMTIRTHLYLLSRLSAALHDAAFKDVIARRASRNEILEAARRVDGSLSRAQQQTSP
jgi:PTS system nitrogen regulatory IIA component